MGSGLSLYLLAGKGIPIIIGIAIGIIFIIPLIQVWPTAALVYTLTDPSEKISVVDALKKSRDKIFPTLSLQFLLGFIITGGSLLFFIPGAIYLVWFSLSIFVLFEENIKGLNALVRSREYVRNYSKEIVKHIFFQLIISGAISYTLSVITRGFSSPLPRGTPQSIISLISYITSIIIPSIITPIVFTYQYTVYKNLRALKKESQFSPSTKQKLAYILIPLLGILGPIIIITTSGLLSLKNLSSLKKYNYFQMEKDQKMFDTPKKYPSYPQAYPTRIPTLKINRFY